MTPCTRAAVLKAAKEAGTVLSVQALVAILFIALLHVCGVIHLDGGGWAWANVHCRCLLWKHKHTECNNTMERSHSDGGNTPWPFFLPWPLETYLNDWTTLMMQNAFLKNTHTYIYVYTWAVKLLLFDNGSTAKQRIYKKSKEPKPGSTGTDFSILPSWLDNSSLFCVHAPTLHSNKIGLIFKNGY